MGKVCRNKKTDGTIEQRRAKVSAKLKAKGTTTLEVITYLCKTFADEAKVIELYNEYAIILELIILKDEILPKTYNFVGMNEAIWEIKPAHLAHRFNVNNSRKLSIKTFCEDYKFKYIPCNSIYAGELQPNTYFKESEILVLNPSEPFEMEGL